MATLPLTPLKSSAAPFPPCLVGPDGPPKRTPASLFGLAPLHKAKRSASVPKTTKLCSNEVMGTARPFLVQRRDVLLGAATLASCGGGVPVARAAEGGVESPIKESDTVFVVGATGATGSRVVKQLLARGVKVRAGVRDVERAKAFFGPGKGVEFVRADVTEGADALVPAIGNAAAVVCATGFTPSLDFGVLTRPWQVDNIGTCNLVDATKRAGAKKFVLVSSLLTNGAAVGQGFNQNYLLLNLFGLVLVAKLQAENHLRASGLDFTVVRPGGLSNNTPAEIGGNLVVSKEDTLFGGRISRDTVAEVVVQSLFSPDASNKVLEIVADPGAPKRQLDELLAKV